MSESDLPVGTQAGPEPPMLLENGKRNPDHLRWQVRLINKLSTDVAQGKCELPRGYNLSQAKDLIETEAKLNGYDPKHLMDVRTDAQVFADTTAEILCAPDELFATVDQYLHQIETQMDVADKHCIDLIGTSGGKAREVLDERAQDKRLDAEKKVWRERVQRIKRVRERARDPFPTRHAPRDSHAIRAAHPLRFMAYCGRSSKDGDNGVFKIGYHHAKMAVAIYEARNQIIWSDFKWHKTDTDSVLMVCPPGHGKSTLAAHWVVLEIDFNPSTMGLIGHAQAGEAEKDLAYVASYFDREYAQARRNRSLFPLVPEVRKSNSDTFDLHDIGGEKKRQPTIKAHGMTGKISGADARWIWFDDPCDQELAEQETVRKRIFDRMNGTWRTRKRGMRTFEITTTTLWHHDDPNMKRLTMAKERKIKNLRVSHQKCGGPDDNFTPLWDQIPSRELRKKYAEWRNPRLYAAAYQSDPQPESLRKIRRLAYYDPTSEAHKAFMQSAIFHVSLDPTATNKEKSDHASFVYAGCGDLVRTDADGSQTYERRMRLIDGKEFHANQSEGVDEVCAFAELHSTHYVHSELVSAFEATKEFFEQKGLDVIPHQPHGKSKAVRLGHVAPMMDDYLRSKGFPGAVVEFPGMVLPDGSIGPDPDSPLAWLEDQVLNFGVAKGDHGVDALVYLCKHVGPEMNIGEGAVTVKLKQRAPQHPDPRVNAMLEHYGNPERHRGDPAREETDFFLEL